MYGTNILYKRPPNRFNAETQDDRSIIAYRPVNSRTVIDTPVTDDCVFFLSPMLRDWTCSSNYLE